MRVLVLQNMYPPHHYGGYELSCRDVVERMRHHGHDVTILTTTMRVPGVEDPPNERADGVLRDLLFYWEDHRIVNPSIPRRAAMERHNQSVLADVLGRVRPDVVSAWNMGAMSLGLLTTVVERAIPLVLNVCDEWPLYGLRMDAWSRLFLDRPRIGAAARRLTGLPTTLADLGRHAVFLYNSDMIRSRVETASRWRPRMSAVVYTGIEVKDFSPPSTTDRPWRWRLLSVGRIDDRKGIHIAVEALARLPAEATLDVVGRGDEAYLADLRDRVRALGLDGRVRFDVTERAALRDLYVDADVLVFPTIWPEPFGLVPVEAMACRTPVVATGTGGSGEFLVGEVNCLRIPPEDPAALAAAVERLARDPVLRTRLIESGAKTAEDLTVDRLAEITEAWHVAAADRFSSGRPAERRLAIA